ncbi:MAG: hypothetical protein V5A34_09105 [Halapricum sp.]
MGLIDAIKSVFGGSDESDENTPESKSESSAAVEAPDADQKASGGETVSEDAGSDESLETESGSNEPTFDLDESATAESSFDFGKSAKEESTSDLDESASEESSFDFDDSVAEESTAAEAGSDAATTAEGEAGFDHLTTEDVSDGPDMAEEAAEFITEAESDDGTEREEADTVDDIPEDDPRTEFVEATTELADFWGEYELDFSLESLTRVDDLVDEQWEAERFEDVEFGGEDYDAQVYTETTTQLGSYFGEVLVRQQDGTWQQEAGVGWTVNVPAGPDSEAAGATVTVFQVAEDCLTGESTFTGMHDALADRLNLPEQAGEGDTPVDLDRADIETVATDNEIEDAAKRLREGAEDLADRWPDYELDFSVESLERLEELLEAEVGHERFEGVELGDETDRESMLLTAHVVGVAGYLSEVLRQQQDAEWAEQGRMMLVVEHDDSRTRIDPIEVAIATVRGTGSLTAAVPDIDG